MDNKFTTLHKTTEEKNQNKFNEIDNNLALLNKKIDEEREDRLKQSDENLRQIRQQLNRIITKMKKLIYNIWICLSKLSL